MPGLADVAAAVVWTELGCSDLLVLRTASASVRSAVRPACIAALADVAVQFGPKKRLAALRVLANVSAGGDARTAKLAAQCLSDPAADVRHAAARAVASSAEGVEPSEAAELASACLCPALADRDPRVCAAAARALPRLATRGNLDAVAAALGGLRNETATVRRAAMAALGEVAPRGDTAAIAKVAAAAEADADWGVRAAACRVLPRLAERGDEVAHRALMVCLKDSELSVRHVAMGAVVHISIRPSQHFVTWAPHNAASNSAGGPASVGKRKRPRQQRMSFESPVTPPPTQRRRTSANLGGLPILKKLTPSGRAVGRR